LYNVASGWLYEYLKEYINDAWSNKRQIKKKNYSSYSSLWCADKQSQWSSIMEIINFKKEPKLHFEFPILCQNNLHSTDQRNPIVFI